MPQGYRKDGSKLGFQKGHKKAKYKPDCQCSFCKAKRGELSGKNHPMYGKFGKDNPIYGLKRTQKTKDKISASKSGKNHPNYIKNPTLEQLNNRIKKESHRYIIRVKGKASNYKCVDCNKHAKDWSNINDHVYRKKIKDFVPRCTSCHRKYDIKYNNKKFPIIKN